MAETRPQAEKVGSLQDMKALRLPSTKPDAGKAIPYQEKMDIDGYVAKLNYSHLDKVRKRMVENPGLECKHKHENEAPRENKKRKICLEDTTIGTEAIKHIERKKLGTGRYC
jgi:hypothetical protein